MGGSAEQSFLRGATFGLTDMLGLTEAPGSNIPMPVAEKPEPVPIKETGMDKMDLLRKRRRAGRSSTVKTGDLNPPNIGKKSLLG